MAMLATAEQHQEIEELLFELETEMYVPAGLTRGQARTIISSLKRRLENARP